MVNADNSFEVLVDQTVVNSGNLLKDMTPPVNPPAEIEDPDDHKPEDWDERPKIQDPDAVKPEDWSESAVASPFLLLCAVTMVTLAKIDYVKQI